MPPTPFIFGKTPSRGDFVRAGSIGPLVDDLDEWLQRGLLAMRAAPPASAPAVSFVFGRPQGTLAGAFVPSRDRAGRAFPLVAGGAIEGAAPPDGAAVAALGPFLTAAAGAAAAVVEGAAPDEALPQLEHASGPAAPVLPAAAGAPLAEALAAFRQPQAPRYGLGLPLPAEPSMRAAAAGQWLDRVVEAGPRRAALSVLWSGASDARAVVFAGPPSADSLAYLLAGAPVDGVYEVGAATPAAAPA